MNEERAANEDILKELFMAKVISKLSQKVDTEEFFEEFLHYSRKISNAKEGFVYLLDSEKKNLKLIASTLSKDDRLYETFSSLDFEAVIRISGTEARILNSSDFFFPVSSLIADYGNLEMFFIPLFVKKEMFAILFLLLESHESKEMFEKMKRFSSELNPALHNISKVRDLRELVIKDDTADCYNRRYFDSYLIEEISRSTRFNLPLSIIFLDVDNLKEVNTQFGHSMGSKTLFEVSIRVKANIRKIDKLFRYGGDEFCIILPETDANGSYEVAERLREIISEKPFLVSETGGMKMTASFGIASFPVHAETKEELIMQADRAMQKIKSLGKNSISIAETLRS